MKKLIISLLIIVTSFSQLPTYFTDDNLKEELIYLNSVPMLLNIAKPSISKDHFSFSGLEAGALEVRFIRISKKDLTKDIKKTSFFPIGSNDIFDFEMHSDHFNTSRYFFYVQVKFPNINPTNPQFRVGALYTAFRRLIIHGNSILFSFKDVVPLAKTNFPSIENNYNLTKLKNLLGAVGEGGSEPPDFGGGQGGMPSIPPNLTTVTRAKPEFQWK